MLIRKNKKVNEKAVEKLNQALGVFLTRSRDEGYNDGVADVMREVQPLLAALQKIQSGLTTDINKVEFYTKREASEALNTWYKRMGL